MQQLQTSAGFGSPVGSPSAMSMAQTPEPEKDTQNRRTGCSSMHQEDTLSPLMFKRTPAVQESPNSKTGKSFTEWVVCTSPFTGQKTPPTVSMKSVVDGAADENTPPAVGTGPPDGSSSSQQHFQAWLKATSSARWTPKASPATAALTPAQAPSPAITPMSICQLPVSAASPATAEPRSRPLFDLHDSSSSDEDGDETYTTVGLQQVAAGAARMRAALAASGMAAHPQVSTSALPRNSVHAADAETAPLPPAGVGSAWQAQALYTQQLQPQQDTADALNSTLGQLDVSCTLANGTKHDSKVAAGNCSGAGQKCIQQQDQHQTPSHASRPRLAGHWSCHHAEQQQPASPMQEVISLMLKSSSINESAVKETPSSHRHHQLHHQAHLKGTPKQPQHLRPPASPEQQLIQLMINKDLASDTFAGLGSSFSTDEVPGSAAAASPPAISHLGTSNDFHTTGQQAAAAASRERSIGSASTNERASYTSCRDGSDEDDSASFYSSDSGDDIDVSQLRELCGDAAAAGTPLSDIIGMLLTPELKGTPKFSPEAAAAAAAAGDDGRHAEEEVGPRVLFADDS